MLFFILRDQRGVQKELGLPIELPSIGLCGNGRLFLTVKMMSASLKLPWLSWIPSAKYGVHCFRLLLLKSKKHGFILIFVISVGSSIFHPSQQSHPKRRIVCRGLRELPSDKAVCRHFFGQKYIVFCLYGKQKETFQSTKAIRSLPMGMFGWNGDSRSCQTIFWTLWSWEIHLMQLLRIYRDDGCDICHLFFFERLRRKVG